MTGRKPSLGFALLVSIVAYLAGAILTTWPLVLHLDSYVYGGGGDTWGSLAQWRELAEHNPFRPGRVADLAAPSGLQVPYALNIATWPSAASLWTLTVIFGAIAAANIFTLSGYVLSGVAMYLLSWRLTRRHAVAFIAGWAYALAPYAVTKGAGHWHFVHGWPLVLVAWRMLILNGAPTIRNGILAGIGAAFAVSFTPYYVLFGLATVVAFLAVGFAVGLHNGQGVAYLKSAACAVGVPLVVVVGYALVGMTDESAPLREGNLAQVWFAKPALYFIPDPNNVLVGEWAREFRDSRYAASGENSVYLGWSVVAAALVGTTVLLKRVRTGRSRADLLVLPVLVLVGLAFAMPPYISVLGSDIVTPVGLIYEITTAWRIFIRFVQVTSIGVVLLAAIGLSAILERLNARLALASAVAVFVVIAMDLSAKSEKPANKVPAPGIYQALASAPPASVAEYPLQPAEIPEYDPMLFQELHGKPVINGYAAGTVEEKRALSLADLRAPGTTRALATLGVRYVVVRDGAGVGASGIRGLAPLANGDGRRVYRITARSSPVHSIWGNGLEPFDSSWMAQWLDRKKATLALATPQPTWVRVELELVSFGRSRTAVLAVGRRSARVVVPAGGRTAATLRLDVPVGRWAELSLSSDLAPQSVGETVGSDDPRSWGLGVRATRVTSRAEGGD